MKYRNIRGFFVEIMFFEPTVTKSWISKKYAIYEKEKNQLQYLTEQIHE